MRRRLPPLVVAALAAALVGCGSGPDAPTAAPKPARDLSSESGQLVGGGTSAFKAQLAALKGTPVVVNQWASWCGPCRFEFPFFRSLATKYRGRVAFLGVDSQDDTGSAKAFLKKNQVPYPSYFDPDVSIARQFKGGLAWPTTAFYDRNGKVVETHAGSYASQDKLEADIRQHALSG